MLVFKHGLRAGLAGFGLLAFVIYTAASSFQAGPPEKTDAAALRVTNTFLCSGEISPLQYGQFMEYLCDLVPSMWAEKLYDGSFEGLSTYKMAFLRQTDFREKPWYPSGAVNRAEYTLDPKDPVSGKVSQKIAVQGSTPCLVGISQDGIAIERDQACLLTLFLRQEGIAKPVRLRLHHEAETYASTTFQPDQTWKKYHARLLPTRSVANATVTIEFQGPGTLWIDNISLMPERTVGGWRPDVVEAVRGLKPGVIRFGGSTLDDANLGDFEWRDTVGDPERRKPFRAWGGLQPTGPGLEEIVQFCRYVGAEPLLCVRFSKRAPQDAADEVQYFNGAADTPMGKLRARNGHPEPYHVKYWQVGNERSGRDYETKLTAFCQAMKQADPTIKLFSSYPTQGVLRSAGILLDYVCPHHYNIGDLKGTENDLVATRALIAPAAPGRPIKIAVTEWNTTGGDWGTRRARLWTLENALACARYHNLLHRYCDIVEIANRSNLTNSFCSGIIQTDNHRLYKTPTYYVQQLYATLAGSRPLKIESPVPADQPLDLSATLTSDGAAVVLFVVNPTLGEVSRTLDFSTFGVGSRPFTVWTLGDTKNAGEPDVTNSFAIPERVVARSSNVQTDSPHLAYRFPALSLTVIRWPTKP
jgi:alpha-N-arabinofuranosidase